MLVDDRLLPVLEGYGSFVLAAGAMLREGLGPAGPPGLDADAVVRLVRIHVDAPAGDSGLDGAVTLEDARDVRDVGGDDELVGPAGV